MAKKYPSRLVVDLCNQPVRISLDIKYRELSHGISARQIPPNFHQVSPLRFLRNPVPRIQRRADIAMPLGRFEQHLPADDVQFCPFVLDSQIANMSSKYSQTAN